jgi:hypothetical protein
MPLGWAERQALEPRIFSVKEEIIYERKKLRTPCIGRCTGILFWRVEAQIQAGLDPGFLRSMLASAHEPLAATPPIGPIGWRLWE